MFVIDAATLYCQRTRSGQLCALAQLDGSTIKRVIDDWGRTPQPFATADGTTIYPPAYQQVLKGLPAVNYSARDIVYRPRNVRAHRVYGYSPVQQVLMTVNIALRRQLWQLDYFTEGSIPDALIGVPQGWTPDQIKQFQDYWDTEFAGDLAKRRRAKFVPGETAAKVVQTKEPQHKDDFDEWLARIICFAFSVPPQWATKAMNRATADNQSAQSEEEGLEPTKEWVKDLIDEIVAEEFASPDLELHWLDEDEGDPETVLEGRLKVGALTLNEMRDALGLDPFDNAAADRPMVLTATGFVPIEANSGGEVVNAGQATANGQRPNSGKLSGKLAFLKASADDPAHPGWPAGTPGGQGGKFRPKDGESSREIEEDRKEIRTTSAWASVHARSGEPERYAAQEADAPKDASDGESRPSGTDNTVLQHLAIRDLEQFDLTNDPRIDIASAKLTIILALIMDSLVRPPDMSPQEYGTRIHAVFAALVKAANITGIRPEDVETTFPEGPYGSPDSIRTDVVLRDTTTGTIIAIYDVKTGKADLSPARADQLRSKTKAPPGTPVIQLRDTGAMLKYLLARSALMTAWRRLTASNEEG
jgi:hypothetical protein